MIQPEASEEKKKGLADKLPKLGRLSQLILLIIGFLIIFTALWFIKQQQTETQVELKTTLVNLTRIISVEETPTAKLEAELAQATAETEAIKTAYPKTDQSPEIIDSLLELAELNDICVTQTKVSISNPEDKIGPIMLIEISLRGQIPKFQNFLLALDNLLPTSQVKTIEFTTGAG